jgi:F-type H+-transporting ATPase subunit delta
MRLRLIARRYAEAFIEYAEEAGNLERALDEIKELEKITKKTPEFIELLTSPETTKPEKFALIDDILGGRFSKEVVQFLKLIVSSRRATLLTEIFAYIKVHYLPQEALNVVLKSAYPLDLDTTKEIEERLGRAFKRELHFFLEIDPDLLGGAQAIIGNTLIDGSLRGQLEDLRNGLKTARV